MRQDAGLGSSAWSLTRCRSHIRLSAATLQKQMQARLHLTICLIR